MTHRRRGNNADPSRWSERRVPSIGYSTLALASVTLAWLASALLAAAPAGRGVAMAADQAQATAPTAAGAVDPRAILNRYCVTCHNERRATASLALDVLDPSHVARDAAQWEKVVLKLRAGSMPPPGMPRPEGAVAQSLAGWLEQALDEASIKSPNPGRPAVHRLNRAEYTNAIRDLLALEIDGRALLPADDSGYGFDNIADVLSVSPALLDRYMSAAGKISRLAVGDASMRPATQTYWVRPTLVQDDRVSDQLPFGTRGGAAVRHYFPADGEYRVKIRLQRTHASQIRGLGESNPIEVRLDRRLVKTFKVGAEGPRDPWSAVPSASFYEQTADDRLEFPIAVSAGTRVLGVAFPRKSTLAEGVLEPRLSVGTYEYAGDRDAPMAVDSVSISGPFGAVSVGDTPSRRRLFTCYPVSPREEMPCATEILSRLAKRAYRRPVSDADVQPLLAFYRSGRAKGDFDAGIEIAVRAVLVDPEFFFRMERDPAGLPAGSVHRLSGLELASRLSFFLWSSIPDDRLLDVAAAGQLTANGVLEREVARMLADPRADALVRNFAGQWLYLRNMRTVTPDPNAFPDFDENLREALQRETELFIADEIRADRGVVELLTADHTFVNERLARHYGIPNVFGNHFRRVTLPDARRMGLLGHGSILTVTSYANRTSPTLRGKWVLENVLGTPPPPPPPNIPALEESDEKGGSGRSVRERLEQHRKNAVCASCHAPMDPFGLALEHFDAIGQWRTHEEAKPIDASAALPDGSKVDGLEGVRGLLAGRADRFAGTVTQKLMTYALGRGVEYYDAPAVRKIVRDAAEGGYRWSAIITGIVKSAPFHMRRSAAP